MKKVGVITWHKGPNYGSALQSYALQQTIKSLGYETYLIDFQKSSNGFMTIVNQKIKIILMLFSKKYRFKYFYYQNKFVNNHNQLTSFCYNDKTLKRATKFLDIIVCGSDQIWAPNLYDERFMASFAHDGQRKVSYAASIGLNTIPSTLIDKYRKHLSTFYAVGVREEKGREILQDLCGIKSQVVLDPTLLLSVDNYRTIEREVKHVNEPYVFCYFLKTDNQYKNSVTKFAQQMNLPIIGVSFKESDGEWMNNLKGQAADNFLWLIDHAAYIFTDSYHCTIFSILFHKKFNTFQRFSNEEVLNQNSRINQLDAYFSISDRFIMANAEVIDKPIDYKVIDKELSLLRQKSINYLKEALS